MITRASKIFFGLALASWGLAVVFSVITSGLNGDGAGVVALLSGDGAVNAIVGPLTFGYKGSVGDHLGFAVLMGFSTSCIVAGCVTSAFRDGDPDALAELANVDSAPPVAAPADLSPWPVVGAVGAAAATVGLASNPAMFAVGLVIMGIAALEWTIKAWSEQATGDAEVNRVIRNRLMYPIEMPLGALVVVVVLGVSASRLLLALPKTGSVIVLSIGAVALLAGAVGLSSLPKMRRNVMVGAAVVVAAVFLIAGVWGAIEGPREFETHGEGHSEEGAGIDVSNSSDGAAVGEDS